MFLKLSFLKLRADVFNQYLEENFTVFFFIMSKCVNFLMGICFKKAFEISHFTNHCHELYYPIDSIAINEAMIDMQSDKESYK